MNILNKLLSDLMGKRNEGKNFYPDNDSQREGYLLGLEEAIDQVEELIREYGAQDIVQVLRLYSFEGPRASVEAQIRGSIQGERQFNLHKGCTITAATLGTFPKVLFPVPPDKEF